MEPQHYALTETFTVTPSGTVGAPPGATSTLTAPWRRLALLGLGLALSVLTPVGASAQFCLNQSDCEDGLFCSVDSCVLGLCIRTVQTCGDFNECTTDRCRESSRSCENAARVGAECEDFDPRTVDEQCTAQGKCVGECVFLCPPRLPSRVTPVPTAHPDSSVLRGCAYCRPLCQSVLPRPRQPRGLVRRRARGRARQHAPARRRKRAPVPRPEPRPIRRRRRLPAPQRGRRP